MLREARRSMGLRQVDVAERAGVTQSWVSRMERGHGWTASLETWAAVAEAASVRLVTFLEAIPGADRPRDYEHLKRQQLIIDLARRGGWTAIPEATLERDRGRLFPRSVDVRLRRTATGERAVVEIWDLFDDVGAAIRSFEGKLADAGHGGETGETGGSPWAGSSWSVARAATGSSWRSSRPCSPRASLGRRLPGFAR